MPVRKVEVERFSLTTSRPFESVVCALKSSIGELDLAEFASASKSSGTFAELEEVINRNMGESGLMLFLEFDHGAVVRKETGLETEDHEASDRQSSSHEGDGQACSGRGV